MNKEQLVTFFEKTNTRPKDFIEWAESMGYQVSPATVSRHRKGSTGISIPWSIAYICFFSSVAEPKAEVKWQRLKHLLANDEKLYEKALEHALEARGKDEDDEEIQKYLQAYQKGQEDLVKIIKIIDQ